MDKEIMCFECGKKNDYEIRQIMRKYEGEDYSFEMFVETPFCKACGAPIYDELIEDKIAQDANKKIRAQREIITKVEIQDILKRYSVSQKFLSRLLGWGEITLTRYISGNYTPNKTNSNKLKELDNPYVFQQLLNDNILEDEGEIEEKPLKKAQNKISQELKNVENANGKMFKVVNWFLAQASEDAPMTHLALQKLLYFTQCWSIALLKREMFAEDCQAWIHGAVYPKVYDCFKRFKYKPLPIVRENGEFEADELEVLQAVKKYYFDVYSARTLENICHREAPYIKAREGYAENAFCQEIISKESIREYYNKVLDVYNIKLENTSRIKDYLNILLN